MKVTMLLADYAVVAEGKLFISGAGWSVAGPEPQPSALAVKIDVPWDRANDKISLRVRLMGEDGQPVAVPGPAGPQPIEMTGEFEVGRPPGLKPGTSIDVPLAFQIGPLPLTHGCRYVWELELDGETNENWNVAFLTRSP